MLTCCMLKPALKPHKSVQASTTASRQAPQTSEYHKFWLVVYWSLHLSLTSLSKQASLPSGKHHKLPQHCPSTLPSFCRDKSTTHSLTTLSKQAPPSDCAQTDLCVQEPQTASQLCQGKHNPVVRRLTCVAFWTLFLSMAASLALMPFCDVFCPPRAVPYLDPSPHGPYGQ